MSYEYTFKMSVKKHNITTFEILKKGFKEMSN